MRKNLTAYLFFLVAILAAGCSSSPDGKVMKKFMSNEIVFPSSLVRIEGRQEKHPDLTVPAVRLIIYVDSLQCSSCHLNRMPQYSKYASLGNLYPDFEVVGIIWPNAESSETIAADVAHRSFPFDIFIDEDGSFGAANPSMPKNRDSHCFLLGTDFRPILVGDPASTKGKEMLLDKTLYSIYGGK
ncbi:MAG: hypothetical protein IKW99_08515 [Bacteroidales bacterium]|nr:hypothetical protein [Bacteroidales bacterium]